MNKNKELYNLLKIINEGSDVAMTLFFQKIGLDTDILKEIANVKIVAGETGNICDMNAYGSYLSTEDKIIIDEGYLCEIQKLLEREDSRMIAVKDMIETLVHEKIHALRRIHTPNNIMDLGFDLPTMIRERIVAEDGEEFNYILPCDVLLDGSCDFKDSISLIERKNQQIFLEEVLTEALAKIIVYNYLSNDKVVSFNEMIKKSIPRSETFTFIGGMILASIPFDIVKWFLSTRSSKEPYNDLIAENYGDEYDDLLYIVETLPNTKSMKTTKYLTKKLCNILINRRSKKR